MQHTLLDNCLFKYEWIYLIHHMLVENIHSCIFLIHVIVDKQKFIDDICGVGLMRTQCFILNQKDAK